MYIVNSVITYVPTQWITYMLRVVVSIHDTVTIFFNQGYKTYIAVLDSFQPNQSILYFYNNSILPQYSDKELLSFDESYWSFDTTTNIFSYRKKDGIVSQLPYISAELHSNNTLENISEWVEKVRVCSPEDVSLPIHILIITWAHSMNKILGPLNTYTLNVITTDGEDKIIDVMDLQKA